MGFQASYATQGLQCWLVFTTVLGQESALGRPYQAHQGASNRLQTRTKHEHELDARSCARMRQGCQQSVLYPAVYSIKFTRTELEAPRRNKRKTKAVYIQATTTRTTSCDVCTGTDDSVLELFSMCLHFEAPLYAGGGCYLAFIRHDSR